MIFGKSRRPFKHKSTASAPKVCIEKPDFNLTIFKIHFGRLTVKLYDKGERTLRAKVVVHNTKDLKSKRGLDSFCEITEKPETILCSCLSNLNHAHLASIDDGTFEQLVKSAECGRRRLAGVDIYKDRIKQVSTVLLILSIKPGGFTCTDLASGVRDRFGKTIPTATPCMTLRSSGIKIYGKESRGILKYIVTGKGLTTLTAVLSLLTKEMTSLVSFINSPWKETPKEQLLEMDMHLVNIQRESKMIRELAGIQIVV